MTPDEADAALRKALIEHAEAYGMTPGEDWFMGDYACVANWQPPSDTDEVSDYTIAYHRASVPHHIAQGLFQVGHDIASTGWSRGGDE